MKIEKNIAMSDPPTNDEPHNANDGTPSWMPTTMPSSVNHGTCRCIQMAAASNAHMHANAIPNTAA